MKFLETIMKEVLSSFYKNIGPALIIAVLFMYFFMYVEREGVKKALQIWCNRFRGDIHFRFVFLNALYISLVLYYTVLGRSIWGHPLQNVIGFWRLVDDSNSLYTQNIENVFLFIPLIPLLCKSSEKKLMKKCSFIYTLSKSFYISFMFSLLIETAQLLFKVGTWQLSDLFFNTLGGVLGSIAYYIARILRKKEHKGNCKEFTDTHEQS